MSKILPKLAAGVDAAIPSDHDEALLVGRVWHSGAGGPSPVALWRGRVLDISRAFPTVRDLTEQVAPAKALFDLLGKSGGAEDIGPIEVVLKNSVCPENDATKPYFLSPIDLHAVKAAGVTFAVSMLERVIEERASGDPDRAQVLRQDIESAMGASIKNLKPGSPAAENLKDTLIGKGIWSQYLEVGIGPDAEIFTKSQILSSVGVGAEIGIHPISSWNNPEPEVVLIISSKGDIVGATLGNDVNLRDVEGRSALLLGKAKDNNASCAIGPFIRLFDEGFGINEVKQQRVRLRIEGEDGFVLDDESSMTELSREPSDMVGQMIGAHHQYPDGAALFLGTMFAPTKDRDVEGRGFTHKPGDVVSISSENLGQLTNRVNYATECPPWTFGVADLMRNLAKRGLI